MKEIKLQKLVLKEFQGGNFVFTPDGEDTSVYAANGVGKTRLASAFSWLLFGKDSLGRSDFELKNLDSEGERAHGLEHTVEGFLLVDGNSVVLKRIYKEIWSKKRGTAQATFTGNTTEYYIDGVPAKENEYKAYISEIMGDEERVKLLTSPTAFPALPWQRQRSLLLEVCGDISDAQVIETDESLSPLTDLLKRYTVSKTPLDDLRKVVTGRKTEINKEIDRIPIRIDEVRRGLPDITGLDKKEIEANIKNLEYTLNDAKLRLSGIDNGGNIAELSKKLNIINADISKLEQDYYNDAMKVVSRLIHQINEIKDAGQNEERQVKGIKDAINYNKGLLEAAEAKLTTLRERWSLIDAETFKDTTEQICAACGQSLPADRVEDARDKALADFNRKRAERLFDIETEGKRFALNKGIFTAEIEKLHESLQNRPNINADELQNLIAQRDTIKSMAEDYNSIDERLELIAQRTIIDEDIKEAKGAVSVDKMAIQNEITTLNGKLVLPKIDLDKFPQREAGEKRVAELKAEEKTLSKEYEDLERQLFLIESFIKRKVSLLNERINGRFNLVRFKLFETQINGGISDCCEITVNGVPFGGGLNNAARIQAGCEIVSVLQEHYGIAPVIFIDNRESVSEIPDMRSQVINLIVSAEDRVLRVEKSVDTHPRFHLEVGHG